MRDDMEIVVKVLPAPTMLGTACGTRATLTIIADATEVTASDVSKKDVGT